MTVPRVDGSVFPDLDEPPASFASVEAVADYVHRVCAAWDYGVQPDAETFALFAESKAAFDRFPLLTSPAYHAVREWLGWERVSVPTGLHAPAPRYVAQDRLEGRRDDPCEQDI
jgi:hypothetical protein